MGPDPQVAPVLELRLERAGHGAVPILGALGLTLSEGETVALTGPSGTGKTTLLRIVAGLHRDFSGTCRCRGTMTMVFQEPALVPWLDLAGNLALTSNASPEAIRSQLEKAGLGGMEARFPGTLSLGQQRRVALARAFAGTPDLLLMDEPFVSLDGAAADEMMALFEALRHDRRTATLIVTHDLQQAERLASRVLRLYGRPAVFQA